jgi:antitoxin ParD1/3/4
MKHAGPNCLTIILPAGQMERLDEAVKTGEYASKTDVVLEALRLWEERNALDSIDDDDLKREYEAGLASGEPVAVAIPEFVDRITAWHRREHEEGLASGLAEDLSPEERLARFKAEFALGG